MSQEKDNDPTHQNHDLGPDDGLDQKIQQPSHQGNIDDIDNNTPPIREQTGPKLWICKLLNIHILIPTTSLKDINLL